MHIITCIVISTVNMQNQIIAAAVVIVIKFNSLDKYKEVEDLEKKDA